MEGNAVPKPEQFERRKSSRIKELLDVDAVLMSGPKAGDQLTGKIINISKGGAAIIFKETVPERSRLNFTIYSDDDQSLCSGTVIWAKEIKGRLVHGIHIPDWQHFSSSLKWLLP